MIEYLAPSLPSFPNEEYEARMAAARALMEVQQLDALLITSEPNFRYFTGDTAPAPFLYQGRMPRGIDPMARVVRVLVHCYTDRERSDLHHVYLDGARALRDDLPE